MIGDHHAAYLQLGQFAGQRFFRQSFDDRKGSADDERAHRGRHRARIPNGKDVGHTRSNSTAGLQGRVGRRIQQTLDRPLDGPLHSLQHCGPVNS